MFIFSGSIEQEVLLKAAKGTIKIHAFEPFNLQEKKVGSLNIVRETLLSERFDPGYIYVVQNICCWEEGTGTPQVKIGIYDGVTKFPYEIGTVIAAEDSVAYIGQLLVIEGRKIYADFEAAVAGDTIYMNINGYRVKR